jgi:hypothetical protein
MGGQLRAALSAIGKCRIAADLAQVEAPEM